MRGIRNCQVEARNQQNGEDTVNTIRLSSLLRKKTLLPVVECSTGTLGTGLPGPCITFSFKVHCQLTVSK